MQSMSLEQLARITGGRLQGNGSVRFTDVSIDTRSLPGNALFVAVRGERFDGHDFVADAATAGAVAAVVERGEDWPLPVVVVADARLAMARLANHLRRQSRARVVAVTGSNGKTTVKEMLAAILGRQAPTLATIGNLNNEIGVPLTLFRLEPEHEYAVIETGANHAGEIGYLAAIAAPDVGIVTNAGSAHLEGFGGYEGIARGKGEMFAGLGVGATAVINADSKWTPLWRQLCGPRSALYFGMHQEADVSAKMLDQPGVFQLLTPVGEATVRLPLQGEHNVMNALAATAACLALGLPLSVIAAGLERVAPVSGRLNWCPGVAGARVLDDTYNANPDSLGAGLAVLVAEPGEHWLVLGAMAELGSEAAALHAAAGRQARQAGISRLFSFGETAAAASHAFGEGGAHFESRDALVAALRAQLHPQARVLVKGSRSMAMEQVVAKLRDEAGT